MIFSFSLIFFGLYFPNFISECAWVGEKLGRVQCLPCQTFFSKPWVLFDVNEVFRNQLLCPTLIG